MTRRLAMAVVCAASIAVAAGAMPASASAQIGTNGPAPSAEAGQAMPSGPTTVIVRGTILKYDARARTLRLATLSGIVEFPIAPATRLRQGSRTLEARDLEKRAGSTAAVRYSESAGARIVQSVHVLEASENAPR